MGLLTADDIKRALGRLGELADERDIHVKLVVAGGAVMVLRYSARESTKDVDAVIVEPDRAAVVRELAVVVAEELGWEHDWLNDGVKGYIGEAPPEDTVLLRAPGVEVVCATVEQMLATKLSALRDAVDRADAVVLMGDLEGDKEDVWARVARHLRANDMKACYAFEEIWDELHDDP